MGDDFLDAMAFRDSWIDMTKNIPFPTEMCGMPIGDWELTPDGFKMKEKKSEP